MKSDQPAAHESAATKIAVGKMGPVALLLAASLLLPLAVNISDPEDARPDDLPLYIVTFIVPILLIGGAVFTPLYLQIRLAATNRFNSLRLLALLLTVVDGAWLLTVVSTVQNPTDSFFLDVLSGFLGISGWRRAMAWLLLMYVAAISLMQLQLTSRLVRRGKS